VAGRVVKAAKGRELLDDRYWPVVFERPN